MTKRNTFGRTDVIVGSNIKLQRLKRRISQVRLGKALGLSFQQIQKYERGGNRVGVSTLVRIAEFLQVDILVFFEGVPGISTAPIQLNKLNFLTAPHSLRAVAALAEVKDAEVRRLIVNLIEAIGATHEASK